MLACPTVLLGDKVILNAGAYAVNLPYSSVRLFRTGSPKRGDLVLLHILNDPHLKFPFFKRVMGLSGDSRDFGPVSEDLLLGKVIATFATGARLPTAYRKPASR